MELRGGRQAMILLLAMLIGGRMAENILQLIILLFLNKII
jgi:hypothetical protein